MLAATAGQVQAEFIPVGIQSNVSAATVASWGWTEIHRSGGTATVNISSIISAATGDYLMMGVWDKIAGKYAILGAGATSVVTAITYASYTSDDGGTTLNNWSNGINFYRTAGTGSWGFTSNNLTQLDVADILLLDGMNSLYGQAETELSKGLSFHSFGSDLFVGWGYNTSGNSFSFITENTERVFFTTNSPVPEPASLAMWSVGALGAMFARRKRQQKKLAP